MGVEMAEDWAPLVRAAPHLPQKFEVGGLSALQFEQTLVSAIPH
jgi:hypothetical protein